MIDTAKQSNPLSEIILATLLGQSIWLFANIREKWLAHYADKSQCPAPYIFLVGGFCCRASDSASFARIVDWVSRGGTKESVSPDDVDLRDAYGTAATIEKAGGKKAAAPAKGKVNPDTLQPSLIRGFLWLRKTTFMNTITLCGKPMEISNHDVTSPREDAMHIYEHGRSTDDVNALMILRRFTRKSKMLLYIVGTEHEVVVVDNGDDTTQDTAVIGQKGNEASELSGCLKAFTNLAMTEIIVSCILDMCSVVVSGTPRDLSGGSIGGDSVTEGELDDGSASSRVAELVERRRQRLSDADMLQLLHLSGVHYLPPEQLALAFLALQQFKSTLIVQVRDLLEDMSQLYVHTRKQACAIEDKLNDESTNEHVSVAQTKLCALFIKSVMLLPDDASRRALAVRVDELVCLLGDLIDDTYRRGSALATVLEVEVGEVLHEYAGASAKLNEKIASTLKQVYAASVFAFSSLLQVLQEAGYATCPWQSARHTQDTDSTGLLTLVNDQALVHILSQESILSDWFPDVITDTVRLAVSLQSTQSLASTQTSEDFTMLCVRIRDKLDLACHTAHNELTEWDMHLCNIIGMEVKTSGEEDLHSLLASSRVSDTRQRLLAFVKNNHIGQKHASFEPSINDLDVIYTSTLSMHVIAVLSKILRNDFYVCTTDFEEALHSSAHHLRDIGVALPPVFFHGHLSTSTPHKLGHQRLVVALLRRVVSVPLVAIARLRMIVMSRILSIPQFLNLATTDTKLIRAFGMSKEKVCELLEAVAWSCTTVSTDVEGDKHLVPLELLTMLCKCVPDLCLPKYIETSLIRSPTTSLVASDTVQLSLHSLASCTLQAEDVFRLAVLASMGGHASDEGLLGTGPSLSLDQLEWVLERIGVSISESDRAKVKRAQLPTLTLELVNEAQAEDIEVSAEDGIDIPLKNEPTKVHKQVNESGPLLFSMADAGLLMHTLFKSEEERVLSLEKAYDTMEEPTIEANGEDTEGVTDDAVRSEQVDEFSEVVHQ